MRNVWKLFGTLAMASVFSLGCGGDDDDATDGGDDGGVTQDAAVSACTPPGGSNPCGSDQYCDTDLTCKKRCNALISEGAANPCTGTTVCSYNSGKCEEPCANGDCLAQNPPKLCDTTPGLEDNSNACEELDTATGWCSLAQTATAIPEYGTNGPMIYELAATVRTGCPSGQPKGINITVKYKDPNGNAAATNGQLCAGNHFTVWRTLNGNAYKIDNACSDTSTISGNATEGTYTVPVCFSDYPTGELVVSINDMADVASNKACLPIPAQ